MAFPKQEAKKQLNFDVPEDELLIQRKNTSSNKENEKVVFSVNVQSPEKIKLVFPFI